jgi:hypothetical protein
MSRVVRCNSGRPNVACSHSKIKCYNWPINWNQTFSFFHSFFSPFTFTYSHLLTTIPPSIFSKVLFYLCLPLFFTFTLLIPFFHKFSSFLFASPLIVVEVTMKWKFDPNVLNIIVKEFVLPKLL